MERREAYTIRSPSLLVTVFYYSIPSGMLGGASISINPLELTAHSAGFVGYSRRFLQWAAAQRERWAAAMAALPYMLGSTIDGVPVFR
jgi:hypothetical protein